METSRNKKQDMVHGSSRSVRTPRDEGSDSERDREHESISRGTRDRRRMGSVEESHGSFISQRLSWMNWVAPKWSSNYSRETNIVGDEGMG